MQIIQTNICSLLQPGGWTALPSPQAPGGQAGAASVHRWGPTGLAWGGCVVCVCVCGVCVWCVCVWCVVLCTELSAMNGTSVDGISVNNEKLKSF